MPERSDSNLARTLIKAGTLKPEQFEECRAVARDAAGATAIEIAVRRGYVTAEAVEAARAQAAAEKAKSDALRRDAAVAKLALQRQFVTREKIEECRREQLARQAQGGSATLLQTLVDRGCLSEEQSEVLRAAVGEEGRRRLGDFEIIRKLGQGGMGAVYKARQVSLDRLVALKILPPDLAKDEQFVRRFYREAQVSAKLDHVNVVRGLAVGEAEGHHYFAMEFVDGRNLKDILEQEGPLPPWRAVPILRDVAMGLAHAHAKDLIHRDIKPENIMLTRDGVPKLADLGLAKETTAQRSGITESGTTMGTAYYMPPEQARDAKRADKRSDIYALGATFYHVLTGRVPFQGESSLEVLRKHETELLVPPRKLNDDIPDRLSLIIEKMMNKKPELRYQSANDVVADLEKVEVTPPRPAAAPSLPRPAPPPDKDTRPPELWYVGIPGPTGKPSIREFDLPTLQRFIEEGRLPTDAPVRRGKTEPFKTMDRYPQLARALEIRRGKEREVKERSESFAGIYDEYERRLRRKALMRALRRIASIVVALGLLAVGAYLAVTRLLPAIRP